MPAVSLGGLARFQAAYTEFAVAGNAFTARFVGHGIDDSQTAPGLRQDAGSLADDDRFWSSVVHVDTYLVNTAPQTQADRWQSVPHSVRDEFTDGERGVLNDGDQTPSGERQTDIATRLASSGFVVEKPELCGIAIEGAGRVFLLIHIYGLPAERGRQSVTVSQGFAPYPGVRISPSVSLMTITGCRARACTCSGRTGKRSASEWRRPDV